MIDKRQTEDRLWREALDHVLAVRSPKADPAAAAAAARWRSLDPAHESAYREAEAVWRVAGTLPAAHADTWQAKPRRAFDRRGLLFGGGALAAAIAAIAVVPPALRRFEGGVRTGAGEMRTLTLPDGSRVALGPESHIQVDVDGSRRSVSRFAGDAYFEVAPDRDRPFVVFSRDIRVRVVGTAFELRQRGDRFSVAVSHGRVEVRGALPANRRVGLDAGDRLAVDTESGSIERGRVVAGRIAPWRDRMIVVERRPVRAVIDEISPWYAGRIVILDAALGDRPVSGVFDLENPVAALEAVVGPFGGRVHSVTPWLAVVTDGK